MSSTPKILVIGCGGIGGVVTGHLAELGLDVRVLSRNAQVTAAIEANGLILAGEGGRRAVPVNVVSALPDERFDYVLLATQPTDVEAAARQALPTLAPDGRMVCFQNGLCEDRVARVIEAPDKVLGGIIAWGASTGEPGVFDRTSAGGFVLGRMDGAADPAIDALADVLEVIGPVQRTDNLAGARWSKLALNCAVSALGTLNGTTLGVVVRQRVARRIALSIMTETVAVARAAGVRLVKVSGTLDLERLALRPDQKAGPSLATKHALILAVGLRYRRLKSSMLRAIERGRPPAVDFLNGEVARRGAELGVPTPVNDRVRDAVWALSRGEVNPGPQLIKSIHQAAEAAGRR